MEQRQNKLQLEKLISSCQLMRMPNNGRRIEIATDKSSDLLDCFAMETVMMIESEACLFSISIADSVVCFSRYWHPVRRSSAGFASEKRVEIRCRSAKRNKLGSNSPFVLIS